jgi:hypothetical protein
VKKTILVHQSQFSSKKKDGTIERKRGKKKTGASSHGREKATKRTRASSIWIVPAATEGTKPNGTKLGKVESESLAAYVTFGRPS